MTDDAIWKRMPGEPGNWYARFLIFRDMGPDRTKLGAVHQAEAKAVAEGRKKQSKRVSGAWNKIIDRWNWEERAAAYDKEQHDILERKLAKEKDHALNTGLGQMHERVKALKEMEKLVKGEIVASSIAATLFQESIEHQDSSDDDGSTGERSRKRKKQGISATLLEQWRGLLDDIAKEKGERIKKTELSGKDGEPIKAEITPKEGVIALNVRKLSDEQLDVLLSILEQSEAAEDVEGGDS